MDTTILYAASRRTTLGELVVVGSARGLRAIGLDDDGDALRAELAARCALGPDDALEGMADAIAELVEGRDARRAIPLDVAGSPFQRRVWDALCTIPRGAVTTYAAIARAIGAPAAVRAVGSACGQNPLAIVVPCHRVVRSDGGLGGYRWGLPRKAALLEREGARPAAL